MELTSFKPLKARGTAQAGVYDQLRQALLNAEFRPGQLLSVRTLADAFGVSAMPVREAASRLIAEGCLEALNQRGLRVPVIDEAKAKEILALRLVLEGLAVERVARSATVTQIRKLEQIEQRLETAAREGDLRLALKINTEYHLTLYRFADDATLFQLIQTLFLLYAPSFVDMVERLPSEDALYAMVHSHHGRMLQAFRDHDPAAARQALIDDISTAASVAWG